MQCWQSNTGNSVSSSSSSSRRFASSGRLSKADILWQIKLVPVPAANSELSVLNKMLSCCNARCVTALLMSSLYSCDA